MQEISGVSLPKVLVIIPMKNEEEYIARCLQSVIGQDYPGELIEVIVVDGGSKDNSVKIVKKLAEEHPNIRLLGGPGVNCPAAMNMGITNAKGELISKIDGHGYVAPDFLKMAVKHLSTDTGIMCVGGPIEPVTRTKISKANAMARSSLFGVGKGVYSMQRKCQFVDTVQCGIYRKDVFEEVGLFDESLQFGEDEEINWRIRKKGYKILSTPDIRFSCFSRGSFFGLFKQYYNYGVARVRVIRKHPEFMRIKHMIPTAFTVGLAGSGILAMVSHLFLAVFSSIILVYLMATMGVSIMISKREGWEYLGLLPVSFGALHLGYGIGFSRGILEWLLFCRRR